MRGARPGACAAPGTPAVKGKLPLTNPGRPTACKGGGEERRGKEAGACAAPGTPAVKGKLPLTIPGRPAARKGGGEEKKRGTFGLPKVPRGCGKGGYFLLASSMATATATVAPTMGLLPMPMRPIISTWAGTEEEPANWASECMRPMVSVMP